MPAEVRVPQMGESVTEATILRWLKQVGDTVAAGESLAELETDKVNVEVPADSSGVIQSLAHAEGDTVAVGDVLAVIGDSAAPAVSTPAAPTPTEAAAPAVTANGSNGASAPAASPLARTLAEEAKIDLAQVKGTGPAGRITKDDVTGYLGQTSQTAPAQAAERQTERAAEYGTTAPPPSVAPASVPAPPKSAPAAPTSTAGGRPEERVKSSRSSQGRNIVS